MVGFRRLLFFVLLLSISSQTLANSGAFRIPFRSEIKPVWYVSYKNNEVPKHHKLELGFALPKEIEKRIEAYLNNQENGLNPYNPKDINVTAEFTSPSGKLKQVNAFYYVPIKKNAQKNKWIEDTTSHHWRVRFAPDEVGTWSYTLSFKKDAIFAYTQSTEFVCSESNHKGRLKISNTGTAKDRYLSYENSDEPFFAVGGNITHSSYGKLTASKAENHKVWLNQLADYGGNFYKLELGAQNALPDWDKFDNYTSKMEEMWEYDQLVDLAEDRGIYFMMFRHHVEVNVNANAPSWNGISWNENPFKVGFDLKSRKEYYTKEEVIEWQKNTLRYIFARWGYSPNFAFYGHAEWNYWIDDLESEEDLNVKDATTIVRQWFQKQKTYITEELNQREILFFNAYANYLGTAEESKRFDGLFNNSDLIGIHQYGESKDVNFNYRYNKVEKLFENFKKPFLFAEIGINPRLIPIYSATGINFHNSIWATSFMGGIGTGLNWWWDRGIHDLEYFKDYKAVSVFFKNEPLKKWNYFPQKWSNSGNFQKTTIENFALVSENKERALGWVHNATHYWRNYYDSIPRIKELVDNGFIKRPMKTKDGWLLKGDDKTNLFSNKDLADNYGKPQTLPKDATFKVKGFKNNFFKSKKHWYRVDFYSTQQDADGKPIESIKIHSDWLGNLKIIIPEFGNRKPDYAYKISYLGQFKGEPK